MATSEAIGLQERAERPPLATWDLWYVAVVVVLVHSVTNWQYGFHRDELQFLSDAHHLDWGFVAYPPFTPLLERALMGIFGTWIVGLRLGSVLFQAAAVLLTGCMAREFGGTRMTQVASAVAVALSPLPLFEATEFQYSSFDYLWWVLAEYAVIRLLNTRDGRWWVAIGAAIGMGMETKYTMAFFALGVAGAVLLSDEQRWLRSKWLWLGVAVAIALFLPNLLWQWRHGWVSLHFLQHIHARDVRQGRTNGFLVQQLWLCTNPFATWLWVPGLVWVFRQRRYRMLGWMYAIPLVLFVVGRGRGYYFAAVYPMLIAAGAAVLERRLRGMKREWAKGLEVAWWAGLAVSGAFFFVLLAPVLPLREGGTWAMKINGDLREEIGWEQLVAEVARIRDGLPPREGKNLAVFTSNYGERGAVEWFGPKYGLGRVVNPTNTAWYWGYGDPPPERLIVLGRDAEDVEGMFAGCKLAGRNPAYMGVKNEETESHPEIFVCGPPKEGWAEFWRKNQWFG